MARPGSRPQFAVAGKGRPRGAGRLRTALLLAAFFVIGAGAALLYRQTGGIDLARLTGTVDTTTTSAYAPPSAFQPQYSPRAMPLCGSARRVNCIVDGDTLWLDGEKIRLVNIDAPEVRGRCNGETVRAADATRHLAALLDRQPIRLVRKGEDRYGRTLAAVATPEGDVGDILVRDRLAVEWSGRREPVTTWCAS